MAHYFALGLEDFVLECLLLVGDEITDSFKRLLCGVQERFVELVVLNVNKHELLTKRKLKECFILLPNKFNRQTRLVKF